MATPEERAEALEVRVRALALVNVARHAVGGGELADFPRGERYVTDLGHPLVAALAPCGVRTHLFVDVTCETPAQAAVLAEAWGQPRLEYRGSWVDLSGELRVLTRFIDLFNDGAYPDLVAGTGAQAEVA